MCLTRPARVLAIDGTSATVLLGASEIAVDTRPVGRVVPGEYLLVHAGLALDRIDADEAEALMALLADWEIVTAEAVGSMEARHVPG